MLDADRADDGIEEEVLGRLQNAVLLDAVRQLKPEQQECIVLRFLQGLTVAETSAVMGRSEGAVKQLQLRAVRALAKLVPEQTP
jgi:RNA polymerase sigma-70 factor (ECF subfamily)